jgi:hypothetical protein
MTRERWANIIEPGRYICLTCSGDSPMTGTSGYVGDVSDDSFDFGEVMNAYEHFSNISADPVLKNQRVRFADVVKVEP